MKSIARNYMWWPGLDQDVENLARSCEQCLTVKQKPPVAPCIPGSGLLVPGSECI